MAIQTPRLYRSRHGVFFIRILLPKGPGGLLRAVEHRYVDSGKRDIFDEVVGDGTLWLVLVATLGGTSWYGVGTDIDKAVALREVFAAPQLLASATSDRVTGLLGKIRIDDAKAYVANVAPTVNRCGARSNTEPLRAK